MGKKNKQETPTNHLQTSAQVFVMDGEMEGVCVCTSRPEMLQECQAKWGGRFRVGKLGCDANFWVTLRKLAKRCPSWPGQQLQFPLAEAEIQGSFVLHFFTFSQT